MHTHKAAQLSIITKCNTISHILYFTFLNKYTRYTNNLQQNTKEMSLLIYKWMITNILILSRACQESMSYMVRTYPCSSRRLSSVFSGDKIPTADTVLHGFLGVNNRVTRIELMINTTITLPYRMAAPVAEGIKAWTM